MKSKFGWLATAAFVIGAAASGMAMAQADISGMTPISTPSGTVYEDAAGNFFNAAGQPLTVSSSAAGVAAGGAGAASSAAAGSAAVAAALAAGTAAVVGTTIVASSNNSSPTRTTK